MIKIEIKSCSGKAYTAMDEMNSKNKIKKNNEDFFVVVMLLHYF